VLPCQSFRYQYEVGPRDRIVAVKTERLGKVGHRGAEITHTVLGQPAVGVGRRTFGWAQPGLLDAPCAGRNGGLAALLRAQLDVIG
jgi:hypothetical protein